MIDTTDMELAVKSPRRRILTLTPDEQERLIAAWEQMGPTRVRASIDHGELPSAHVNFAWNWLSAKDRVSEERREAVQSAQTKATARASAAAERAASAAERQARVAESADRRAKMAIAIAAASAIIAIINIVVTYSCK